MESDVLLTKSLNLLLDIKLLMDVQSKHPVGGCPLCAGELISKDDLKLMRDIRNYLAGVK